MSPGQSLSVVVPVHNEAGNIGALIDEIAQALHAHPNYEVVIVNDASDDDTADEVASRRKRLPQLRLLDHERQCGQSAALLTGVDAARHDFIVTLDGDGQNDPADIVAMIDRFDSERVDNPKLAMVCGHRTTRRDTGVKRLSSRVANAVRRNILRDATPDTGCGIKLFERDLFLRLPAFDHMHRFLPALAIRQGGTLCSQPVNHRERQAGRSHYGLHNRLWTGIIDLAGVAWLMRRRHAAAVTERWPEPSRQEGGEMVTARQEQSAH